MTLRDKLAGLVLKGGGYIGYDVADTIIAAIPDMLEPLVWDGFVSGAYLIEIHKGGIAYLWYYDATMVEREEPELLKGGYLNLVSLDDLKAAANAHHVAEALKPFGVARAS